jgi:porphobilinogen synthase
MTIATRLDLPPFARLRRMRATPALRRMARETMLTPANFIAPFFVTHGMDVRRPVASMPGVAQLSVDQLLVEVKGLVPLGVPAILLFGVPARKDAVGSEAYAADGIIQRAVRAVKEAVPEMVVITDVCLCEYTDHGHCGVVEGDRILNDPTLDLLARMAVSHVEAGADIVAPSDMMDGHCAALRAALDAAGHTHTPIMGYSAKFASAFYGPFREAAESAPRFGDRRSYQMDPANGREALREVEADIAEGADLVMVKPALAYLDLIRAVRDRYAHPIAAYNVSGEYAMVKAAAANGWLDEKAVTLEILTGIKRAGADLIITYHAAEAARWLHDV